MEHRVCSSADLKDNSMRLFTVNKTDVLVGRRRSRLFACDNFCPHRGASLSKGELKQDNIVCYMHGYEYNVFSGKLVSMKSWKREETWVEQSSEWRKSGNLVLYPIFEKDGSIFVDMPER